MRPLARLFAASCLLAWAPAQTAPPPENPVLPAADLVADLRVLRTALTQLHPGLLRYRTAAQFDADADGLARTFASGRTLAQAWLDFSRLTATLRCGHTFLNPVNQRRTVGERLFGGLEVVPFAFRWLDDEMVVTTDATPGHVLPAGTRVVALDGRPTGAVLSELLPLVRADGGNDAKRRALLEVSGLEKWPTFDLLYGLRRETRGAPFRLAIVPPTGGERRQLEVAPMPLARRSELRTANGAASGPDKGDGFPIPEWSWRRLGDGVVCLRMDTWALYDAKWDWRAALDAWIDARIDDHTAHVVVDLRHNEGGIDCGDVLLARLVAQPLPRPAVRRFVRYRAVPAELNPLLDTWDNSFRDWGAAAEPFATPPTALLGAPAGGFLALHRDADDLPGAPLAPAGRRLSARLWVLVGAENSSATFQFARAVRAAGLGTLVGTATGGNQRGINGCCFFFLRLPKTGLTVDLPLVAEVPVDGPVPPDAGLQPDLAVRTTAADVARGTDPELAAVLQAIAKPR